MSDASSEEEVESSELGSKEYWDRLYDRECQNFTEFGDIGEVWFGKAWEKRIVDWLRRNSVPITASVLDLGSGNGSLLAALARAGFGRLLGLDYSAAAVELAKGVLGEFGDVARVVQADVLDQTSLKDLPIPVDVLLDKGTMDAISLREDRTTALDAYAASVATLVRPRGHFLLLSCNHTGDELRARFEGETWKAVEMIEGAQMSFGGKQGTTVAAQVFQRL